MSTTNSLFGQRTRLALRVSDVFPQPKLQAHAQQPDVCHPPGPAAVAPALSLQPAACLVLTQTPPRATDLFCSWLRVTAFPSLGCTAAVWSKPWQPGSCRITFIHPQGGHHDSLVYPDSSLACTAARAFLHRPLTPTPRSSNLCVLCSQALLRWDPAPASLLLRCLSRFLTALLLSSCCPLAFHKHLKVAPVLQSPPQTLPER